MSDEATIAILFVALMISFYFVITRTAQEARPFRNIEEFERNG